SCWRPIAPQSIRSSQRRWTRGSAGDLPGLWETAAPPPRRVWRGGCGRGGRRSAGARRDWPRVRGPGEVAARGGAAGRAAAGRLSPVSGNRKIIQSAQLALTTAPARVDTVAQEVFDAVGRVNGIVRRSSVTATGGPDGYAQFQLSVPSSALPDTMAALSQLR